MLGGEVGSITHERIGDGLVGMNLRLTLHDADPALPKTVVVKLPSPDETSRATGIGLGNYQREMGFYLELEPTVDIRVPKCMYGEWHPETGDFVLVLEDMSPAAQGDQLTGCSVERATAAVIELAKLHGPRWGDPTLHDYEWLGDRTAPETVEAYQGLWAMLVPGFEATYRNHLDPDESDLLDRFLPAFGDWFAGRGGPLTVVHGDYRLDNLLFGDASGAPPVTVVDWQTPALDVGVHDLSYFIGAGLVPEDRRASERMLVDRYHEALDAYGVKLDDAWLWEQYRRESFEGLLMATIASQLVGTSARSEALFTTMARRHLRQAIDHDAISLI